jgi:hypothetical protein
LVVEKLVSLVKPIYFLFALIFIFFLVQMDSKNIESRMENGALYLNSKWPFTFTESISIANKLNIVYNRAYTYSSTESVL